MCKLNKKDEFINIKTTNKEVKIIYKYVKIWNILRPKGN